MFYVFSTKRQNNWFISEIWKEMLVRTVYEKRFRIIVYFNDIPFSNPLFVHYILLYIPVQKFHHAIFLSSLKINGRIFKK